MKKLGILILLLISVCATTMAQGMTAYLKDNDGNYTNIRYSPKGEVKTRLNHKSSKDFILTTPVNGWWKIVSCCDYATFTDVKAAENGYIHYSCLAVMTVNDGGERWVLRSAPNETAAPVYTIKLQEEFRPIDVTPNGHWIKVKTLNGKATGWIEAVKVSGSLV